MVCFGATSLGMIPVFSFLSNFVFFVCFGSNRLEGCGLEFQICCAFLLLMKTLLALSFCLCICRLGAA
ncbi:hypothetical protein HanRHA438_Chr04g0159201 [Helianthus annuus]|uniref:Uncharacterized protein n=1 Tax=Helianthus annuus TaxID=4232 RepID=A0A9K3NRF5_HELAN|nr:hypothetical protein HanXRQr2_Chr04g0149251 [Helianthus annuus]KAJ0579854.1 hypothetical protein HanHA300_Chr04g0122691 [Helianthus annuus]KAJ0587171.1 hypothetical protein HanIR_Chr04g0160211 [Helianthus annuus]KAJ0595761.1 hypothetical protein HanHA89_Chr04g0135121 [Helianthus annuus]KAJ0756419.1 hypothetical protein HanLR1_Chr04g0126961 [Helianthus annuus]